MLTQSSIPKIKIDDYSDIYGGFLSGNHPIDFTPTSKKPFTITMDEYYEVLGWSSTIKMLEDLYASPKHPTYHISLLGELGNSATYECKYFENTNHGNMLCHIQVTVYKMDSNNFRVVGGYRLNENDEWTPINDSYRTSLNQDQLLMLK